MANTYNLYEIAQQFQDKREQINTAYNERMKSIEPMRGSRYFDEESAIARKKRDDALDSARYTASKRMDAVLHQMREKNRQRKMDAPTAEQLRIIELLKMMDEPSENDVTLAYNSVADNPLALHAVAEIARVKGIPRSFNSFSSGSRIMSIEAADEAIDSIAKHLRDLLQHDTKRAARIVRGVQAAQYGENPDIVLPKRELFHDRSGFYESMNLVGYELAAFADAVD